MTHNWDEYSWQVGTPEVKKHTTYVQYILEDLRELAKQLWQKPEESVAWFLCLWDNMRTPIELTSGHCPGYMGK
jgi:hypothetical protein